MARRLAILVLGVLALLPAATPAALEQTRASTERSLAGLPLSAGGTISQVLGRDQRAYHARASASGLVIRNAPNALTARFTPRGVVALSHGTRVGLALRAWGYGPALRPLGAAPPQARANRILYRHGALTEWYVNGPLGLEQGFTLNASPARRGSGPLTLALGLSGNASPSLLPDRKGVRFAHSPLRYQGLAANDAQGRILSTWFELRGRTLLLRVDDAGARYPLKIDPFLQLAKLTSSDPTARDNLGVGVAISGDTVAIGAPRAGAVGAVYIFIKPTLGWASVTEAATLTASNLASGDGHFATSVDIDGDTVVAGMSGPHPGPPPDPPPPPNGAAYVFVKPAGGWANGTETARLTASGAELDGVGPVAVSGDTIVFGAPCGTLAAPPCEGAVYVFSKPVAGWMSMNQTATLTASDGAENDQLGYSVAVDGPTVAAGARCAPAGGSCPGAVYMFARPGATWSSANEIAKLTASDVNPAGFAGFGQELAISGDTVVASTFDDAAYVFIKPVLGWTNATETAKLSASDAGPNDRFGNSLAVSGDTVVAGAPGANVSANGIQGAAYVFRKPPLGWVSGTETAKLTASDGVAQDQLGYSVAVTGATVVAGAPGSIPVEGPMEAPTEPLANGKGAAYVFVDIGPTAVVLRSFSARRSGGSVLLRWRTGSKQAAPLGFNVYRAVAAGRSMKLNRRLIAHARGQAYSYRDRSPGSAPRYLLEEVRPDGSRALHGPVTPAR